MTRFPFTGKIMPSLHNVLIRGRDISCIMHLDSDTVAGDGV